MVAWAKDRLKSLNSTQDHQNATSYHHNDDPTRSVSPTPTPTPNPCSQSNHKSNRKHRSRRYSGKHRRSRHTPPRRPYKRRRKNSRRSRIDQARHEAQSQVMVLLLRIFAPCFSRPLFVAPLLFSFVCWLCVFVFFFLFFLCCVFARVFYCCF